MTFAAFRLTGIALVLSLNAFAAEPSSFADVNEQTVSNGFHAAAVYLDDAGQPFGARFVHQKTGFTLDLIQVQSVPQAFAWVNTFPVSDKGEPHTQEHLLMGKGNIGRAWAASETMTLSQSNAFTMQWRTAKCVTSAFPKIRRTIRPVSKRRAPSTTK
jgi:hypothetical protein